MNEKEKQKLGGMLVQEELFDMMLYQRIKECCDASHHDIFDELISGETRHFEFWKRFFGRDDSKLSFLRKIKLSLLVLFSQLFGNTGKHLVLEAIEVYGIRKYLHIWRMYKDDPLGEAIRGILQDEFKHEEETVRKITGQRIFPERVRDIFLGFNDGLVELLGAVSGFFAVFGTISSVLVAGFTVAIAGAISMAAGVYAAMGSGKEIERTRRAKERFLGKEGEEGEEVHILNSAFVVGISYLGGAMVPLLPVFFGAQNMMFSVIISVVVVVIISTILAFISGMDVRRRIAINLVVIAIAVGVTYTIGSIAKEIFGISV